MDMDTDDTSWGSYLRIRVFVDLNKLLARERKISVAEQDVWIPIKYKKLPKFCFGCGRILHEDGGSSLKGPSSFEQHGVWLREKVYRKPWPRKGGGQGNQRPKSHSGSSAKESLESCGQGVVPEQDPFQAKNLGGSLPSHSLILAERIFDKDMSAALKETNIKENANITFETGTDKGEVSSKEGKRTNKPRVNSEEALQQGTLDWVGS